MYQRDAANQEATLNTAVTLNLVPMMSFDAKVSFIKTDLFSLRIQN